MAGLKAVFLKKLSMTAYAMGRYAITRRKIRAGAVVPKIHARRSVVALIAGAPSPYPPPHPALSPSRGRGRARKGQSGFPGPPCFAYLPCPGRGRTQLRDSTTIVGSRRSWEGGARAGPRTVSLVTMMARACLGLPGTLFPARTHQQPVSSKP